MEIVGTVTEIWRYPVSSLGGQQLSTATLDHRGVEGDRLYGLVDAVTGKIAKPDSEKRWRVAPQIRSRLTADGLEISADGETWHAAKSAEAEAAVSLVAGFRVAFRRYGENGHDGDDRTAAAPRYDHAPLHILTMASMQALASRVPRPGEIDRRRFRPNIVIDTPAEIVGFAEKAWIGRTIRVGEARISVTEPCARCSFVALAQADLAFDPSVLHAILREGGGFGVLAAIAAAADISVGDRVVLE